MQEGLLETNKLSMPNATMGPVVACTMFEGHYHKGSAALINSLYRWGYRGVFYVAFRGELPPWSAGKPEVSIAEGLIVRFEKFETPLHYTFCKAQWMNRIFDAVAPLASAVLYFDPDIIVKCPWSFFENWVENRVALVQDVNWSCSRSHPIRREWDRYLIPHGLVTKHLTDYYCNAGFVGVDRRQREFLLSWERVMEAVVSIAGERSQITFGDLNFCFHKADQDSLNVAVDIQPDVISVMGPEAMDFAEGGHTMSHAVGSLKPWKNGFILNALNGRAPSKADKAFMENAKGPISIFSEMDYRWRLFKLRLAAAISRFVRRS